MIDTPDEGGVRRQERRRLNKYDNESINMIMNRADEVDINFCCKLNEHC